MFYLRPIVCASEDVSLLGQNFDSYSSWDPPNSGVFDRTQGVLSFWILWR